MDDPLKGSTKRNAVEFWNQSFTTRRGFAASWVDAPLGARVAIIWLWEARVGFDYGSGSTSCELGDSVSWVMRIILEMLLPSGEPSLFLGGGGLARPLPPII